MKNGKRNISLEILDKQELISGLDSATLYPQRAAFERECSEAERSVAAIEAEREARKARVDHLASEVANGGARAAYERAFAELQATERLVPAYKERLAHAQRALAGSREAMIDARNAEFERRQLVINRAGAILIAELTALDALEQALHAQVMTFPTKPGEGYYQLGSFRDQQLAGVR
jgi:hypothetical protein